MPSTARGNVYLSKATASSPFLLLHLTKTVLSRVSGPGNSTKKKKEERKKEKREKTNLKGSEALKGRCPRWEVIGMGTLSRWVSKATEKRSTFHPPLSCSQHTQLQYTVQLFTTTFFSSTWCKQQANIYFGRNEITYPEDEIYSLLSSS